ncbi:MAG: DUF5317 family protein [Oscillospiraceae bacterium]|nr:DUF5317 family protein [Oscillospiraceae bacterium]
MLTLAVLLAVLASLLTGGRLRNIQSCAARGFSLPVAALLLETASNGLCAADVLPRMPWYYVLLANVYLLCLFFVVLNRRYRSFSALFGAGALANFSVIAANDFYMPVGERILTLSGFSGIPAAQRIAYRIADSGTRLRFLGDILYIPGLGGFASVGDCLMAAGVFVLAFQLMRGNASPISERP